MEKKICDRCGEEFDYLYLSLEGDVCSDCMSDLDDEEQAEE